MQRNIKWIIMLAILRMALLHIATYLSIQFFHEVQRECVVYFSARHSMLTVHHYLLTNCVLYEEDRDCRLLNMRMDR